MKFDRNEVKKSIACCPLLPPPGEEVVRHLGEDWLTLDAELTTLRERVVELEKWLNESNHWYTDALDVAEMTEDAESAALEEVAKLECQLKAARVDFSFLDDGIQEEHEAAESAALEEIAEMRDLVIGLLGVLESDHIKHCESMAWIHGYRLNEETAAGFHAFMASARSVREKDGDIKNKL